MKFFLAILAMAALTGTSFAADSTATKWSGFLIDKSCATHIIKKKLPPDQTEAKVKAHTRECALMADCVAAGYGIWTEGKFIPFDKTGNMQVGAFLAHMQKPDNIAITVSGKLKGKMIAVTSIKTK